MEGPLTFSLFSHWRAPVLCPMPRRAGLLAGNLTISLRWQTSNQRADMCDSRAGAELLHIVLIKEGSGEEQSSREIVSSSPFFCGSPPSRVTNPLVLDAQFRDEKLSPLSTLQLALSSSSSASWSPSAMRAGCSKMKFAPKPATVRVEGFDCLSSDRQNAGITSVA